MRYELTMSYDGADSRWALEPRSGRHTASCCANPCGLPGGACWTIASLTGCAGSSVERGVGACFCLLSFTARKHPAGPWATIEASEGLHRRVKGPPMGPDMLLSHTKTCREKRRRSKLQLSSKGERARGQHNLAHEPLTEPDLFSCTVIFARARQCGCAF